MTVATPEVEPAHWARGRWAPEQARGTLARVEIRGQLEALTPLHLGGGEGDPFVDLPLLRDVESGVPLLCGSSLAGALRAYLGALAGDDAMREAIRTLFGTKEQGQGTLVIEDARGRWLEGSTGPELRSGVALAVATRTAAHDALYAIELWPAGTTFDLRLELLLKGDAGDVASLAALLTALRGLRAEQSGIRLGARTRRGYGVVTTHAWTVTLHDLRTPAGLLTWLTAPYEHVRRPPDAAPSDADLAVLPPFVDVVPWGDARRALTIALECGVNGSLLVRGNRASNTSSPDTAHLHSERPGTRRRARLVPVLPGTSLAGALRARALRIANTVGAPTSLVDDIFGPRPSRNQPGVAGAPNLWASRLRVDETMIEDARTNLVQSRVAIDRFTGGAYPTALFDEQPVFAHDNTRLRLMLRLAAPTQHEIGLVVLVIKDLWTADLPVGGGQAIGRGRLRGIAGDISLPQGNQVAIRAIDTEGRLDIRGDRAALEACVAALHAYAAAKGGAL